MGDIIGIVVDQGDGAIPFTVKIHCAQDWEPVRFDEESHEFSFPIRVNYFRTFMDGRCIVGDFAHGGDLYTVILFYAKTDEPMNERFYQSLELLPPVVLSGSVSNSFNPENN